MSGVEALIAIVNEDAAPPAAAALTLRDVYRAEFRYVYQTVRRLGVRAADLEDVVHDVFLTVSHRWSTYDPARPLRPWLFGVSFRVVSAHRRRHAHQREVLGEEDAMRADDSLDPEKQASGQQQRRLLERCLDTLDDERRAVFVLHEIDEVPVPEVALVLEIPLGTAYTRLRLAREDFAAAARRLQARPVLATPAPVRPTP